MNQAKSVQTPLAQHIKLSMAQSPECESDKQEMDSIPYASGVGSLIYGMVCTRLDLAYSISVVSRFMANPGHCHWEALKWIMRYLKETTNIGLKFEKQTAGLDEAVGYVDSDFAGNLDTRKSLTGYIFTLYGTAVTWKSTLQSVVALSTTEAEYIAVSEAIKEAIWLKGMLGELGIDQRKITIFCDNQSAIQLSKHQVYHERSKHIDVKLHFVRDVISKGEVILEKIYTEDNPADVMTKALPYPKFKKCLDLVRVVTGEL
ncbi:secreted RxLR effector protein 161-like [Henckelia pumila]|uniref:secreted RxLR effector protein 161-like n=1 Tax=Henckelia pumila TaxID=405737 RepID=UPI003C6E961A